MDLVHFAIWKSQKIESLPGVEASDFTVSKFKGAKGRGSIQYDFEREVATIEFKGELEVCPFSSLDEKLKGLCT